MSIGYESIFRSRPNPDNWRAISGDWPDAPWIDHRKIRTPWRGRFGSRAGYWIVALALLMTMATSTIPTPLYVLYQRRDHFSSLMVSVVFAVYAAGVITSLFLVGHVSDWLGRRRVLTIGLFMNVGSAFLFMVAPSLTGLVVARVISGFSVGLTTATATAYLSELHQRAHPEADHRRAQLMAIAVNLGGIGFGPLVAGVLAQFAPAPLVLPYLAVGLVLAALATLVVASPETVARTPQRTGWHAQRVVVPTDARRQFFAACLAGLSAFAVYGMFSSLVPRFLADTMGITSHAVAGLVAFAVFASGALAQMALRSMKPTTLLRTGSPTLLIGLGLLVTGMWVADLALFVIATVVTGVGTGLIFRGAMTTVSESAPSGSRAETLAGFFLSVYVGLSVPVVALGLASGHVSARVLVLVFAVVVALATVLSVRSVLHGSGAKVSGPQCGTTVLAKSEFATPTINRTNSPRGHELPQRSTTNARQTTVPVHESRRTRRTRTLRSDATAIRGPGSTRESRNDQ
jgi:MFS family permease